MDKYQNKNDKIDSSLQTKYIHLTNIGSVIK